MKKITVSIALFFAIGFSSSIQTSTKLNTLTSKRTG
jgi:hypothetical protein